MTRLERRGRLSKGIQATACDSIRIFLREERCKYLKEDAFRQTYSRVHSIALQYRNFIFPIFSEFLATFALFYFLPSIFAILSYQVVS